MSLEYERFCEEIRSFKNVFLDPDIAFAAKMAAEYLEQVKAVESPEHDAHGLLAAIGQREYLTRLSKLWESKRAALQAVMDGYREHFEDYLKE
jgi:hypothetical protein